LQPPHDPDVRGYRIKPHGQLVPVSSSDCSPCTPGLSTSWSWTTLQGDHLTARVALSASPGLPWYRQIGNAAFRSTFSRCALMRLALWSGLGHQASGSSRWSSRALRWSPGKSNLGACFPLRCFQRLSLPHLATRRYDWRHNRYTSGASTPVLSY
jgi:hypothetical protein